MIVFGAKNLFGCVMWRLGWKKERKDCEKITGWNERARRFSIAQQNNAG